MRKFLGPLLATIVAIGVSYGIYQSAQEQQSGQDARLVVARGLIGSEKEGFYRDPRVVAAFARLGLRVDVLKAGSREMAEHAELASMDFGHPAGSPAAQRLKEKTKAQRLFNPFFTPMAVASWHALVPLLEANGLVQKRDDTLYIVDMQLLLGLSSDGKRWNQLKGNKVYDTGRAILVSTTDVRKSNSAAMYLALASYLFNNSNIVQSDEDIARVMPKAAALFTRQGFQESSSAGPFEDYTTMGMGKAPLVMVYESQFIEYQSQLPQPNPEMVLLYPLPTVFTKHVLVPLTDTGVRVGEALENDTELQQLAAEYGFRGSSPDHFRAFLGSKKLSAPENMNDVVDPPSFVVLERMIEEIAQQMK